MEEMYDGESMYPNPLIHDENSVCMGCLWGDSVD